jgi:3-dehydroquinate synthetase
MLAATRLALLNNLLSAPDAGRIGALIESYGPAPPLRNIDPLAICGHLSVDKKVRDGVVHFVLPAGIGAVKIVGGISQEQVIGVLEDLAESNAFSGDRPSSLRATADSPAGKASGKRR